MIDPLKKRDRRAYMKVFRARHKDRLNAYWKQWKIDHKYDKKSAHRRWYVKHRTEKLEYSKAYQLANRESRKVRQKAYDSSPERKKARNEFTKRWRLNNPNKVKAMNMRRRASVRGAVSDISADAMIVRWKSLKSFICYYCTRRFKRTELHIDHIAPLANGGSHTSDNLCASCSYCNQRKHTTPASGLLFIPQILLPV